jgi:3-hydroxyisobutyrate dehydrogenase
MNEKAEMGDSFEAILENSWAMLSTGAEQAQDPFHTPVLGTVSPQGCSLRTIVLRRVIPAERILICHTDVRSPKVHGVGQNPGVSWLFYHPEQKVQLRIVGPATLHTDDALADEQWTATTLMSRRSYCAIVGPGTPNDAPTSGLPDFLETRSPTLVESETGRKHLVVIACRVDFLDWYFLRVQGHRRAQFNWQGNEMTAQWVAP